MAASSGQNGKAAGSSDADLLLHPELLSEDFMQLILHERNVSTGGCESRDRLTELYLRHVMPLPQRRLPESRWGRRMKGSRGRSASAGQRADSSSKDPTRKRPLIVFDGSSSLSGQLKVKKSEGIALSTGITDRLKPPPSTNLSNPIRKLSSSTSSPLSVTTHQSTDKTDLKREANNSGGLNSPEVKKKIQHVKWP